MLCKTIVLGLCLASCSSFANADTCKNLEVETVTGKDFHVISTIVMAEEKAIVVDAQMKLSQATKVADLIESKGKDLQAIWISHAHPDHYLGLSALTARFPNAKVYATTSTVEKIKASGQGNIDRYGSDADISNTLVVPTPYDEAKVIFGDCSFDIIRFDRGDTSDETTIYLPESKTLIATDMIYDRNHLWLAENNHDARMQWIENLKKIKEKAADVKTIIPGHKPVDAGLSDISIVDTMIEYLNQFDKILAEGTSIEDVVGKMKALYPDYGLVNLLELSVKLRFADEHPK
ncbi:MBL fold metallo-hydrolase [Candidatus Albibeggiatoa sp. nov. BB20]|uniref:MBL fold metallo-hydrolase n=1 Tax=Candidatus Albibeggiatoa sp. nov. BB20 TaxID=3162723 RepID=UPI003365769C